MMIFAASLAFGVPSLANAFDRQRMPLSSRSEWSVDWAYLYGVFLFTVVAATATCGLLAIRSRRVRPYALHLAGAALISITAFKWPLAVILILWAMAVRILGFRARTACLPAKSFRPGLHELWLKTA